MDSSFIEVSYVMQPENSFDKLSKRVAVAVSRRSLLRSLSLAVAGAFLPWRKASAGTNFTSFDLEPKFFIAPSILELRIAAQTKLMCVAVAARKDTGGLVIGGTSAKDGQCPADVASYFESSSLSADLEKLAKFDDSKIYIVRKVEGRPRMLHTFPAVTFYTLLNPSTGKEEYEAYCSAFTHLDPEVYGTDSDRKLIHYKRKPTVKPLTSLQDEVECGDINYAYENEIKTRKPIALRDFAVDAVPHQASAKRVNATGTSTSNHSGHKSK